MSEVTWEEYTRELRELARAWRDAWLLDYEGAEEGPPSICEGCCRPAWTTDVEGVPLCEACDAACVADGSVVEGGCHTT